MRKRIPAERVPPCWRRQCGHRRWIPQNVSPWTWALALAGLFTAACQADTGTVGAPEHSSAVVVDSPVGPLQLQLGVQPRNVVFQRPDSIMIHYRVFNPGPGDHAYRDAAEDYYFRVIGPDGQRLYPKVVSATEGTGGSQRILLYPGEGGERHTINLACMPYHAYSFEPLFRPPDPYGCEAAFQFQTAGTYLVIGQRIPPPAFEPEDDWATPAMRRAIGEDTLPSRADTIAIRYQPRRRWWPW